MISSAGRDTCLNLIFCFRACIMQAFFYLYGGITMSKEKIRTRTSEEERIAKVNDNLEKALEKKALLEDSLKKINSKITEYRNSIDKYNRKKFDKIKAAKGLSWEDLFDMMNRDVNEPSLKDTVYLTDESADVSELTENEIPADKDAEAVTEQAGSAEIVTDENITEAENSSGEFLSEQTELLEVINNEEASENDDFLSSESNNAETTENCLSEDDWAQDAVTSHDESAHDDNSYTEQVNIINQWVDEDALK